MEGIKVNMNIEKIIGQLNKYTPEIVQVLSINNWANFRLYYQIKEEYLNKPISDEFKNVFAIFYILNGPNGLNNKQKNKFFELLETRETSLPKILAGLYEIPGYQGFHSLFLSFGTKLLHTLDNSLPIYDRNIASLLELPTQEPYESLEEGSKNRVYIYNELKNDFTILLDNQEIKSCLVNFRKHLIQATDIDGFEWKDGLLSETKLLDSVLWALYTVLQETVL